mmetsp:Transcript_164600/g.528026  ORF Transcript_164600/g.528026 Transcript_164600/m.528026 type:complete len:215 (-) Transcript_164600:330-974(-)
MQCTRHSLDSCCGMCSPQAVNLLRVRTTARSDSFASLARPATCASTRAASSVQTLWDNELAPGQRILRRHATPGGELWRQVYTGQRQSIFARRHGASTRAVNHAVIADRMCLQHVLAPTADQSEFPSSNKDISSKLDRHTTPAPFGCQPPLPLEGSVQTSPLCPRSGQVSRLVQCARHSLDSCRSVCSRQAVNSLRACLRRMRVRSRQEDCAAS